MDVLTFCNSSCSSVCFWNVWFQVVFVLGSEIAEWTLKLCLNAAFKSLMSRSRVFSCINAIAFSTRIYFRQSKQQMVTYNENKQIYSIKTHFVIDKPPNSLKGWKKNHQGYLQNLQYNYKHRCTVSIFCGFFLYVLVVKYLFFNSLFLWWLI